MKNRIVGILIIGIAIIIGVIIYMFNRALAAIVATSCVHGISCPMWGTIDFQTNIGIGLMILVILIGVYLIFFGTEERIVTRIKRIRGEKEGNKEEIKITRENYKKIFIGLGEDDKKLIEIIVESNGTIFQSDIVEKTGMNKVKVTRILDRLEGRGIIERRRRGMTNVVILKNK